VRTYRQLFMIPEFRALLFSFALVIGASTAQGLALATLVFERTASPALAAFSLFGSAFGQLFSIAFLLSAADRVRPRQALTFLPVLLATATLLLAVPDLPVPVIVIIVLLGGLIGSVGGAVRWGLLAEVIPEDGYVLGRSVMQMTVGGMQITGFGAGALLLSLGPPRTLLLLAATVFLMGAATARLGLSERPPRALGRASRAETWRINKLLWQTPGVPAVYLALWVPNGLVVGAEALFIPYAGDRAGLLFMAGALGMLTGDALAGRWLTPALRRTLITPARLLLAAPYLLFAVQPPVGAAAVLVAVASVGFAAGLMLQEQLMRLTPADARGQALGLHSAGMLTMQGVCAVAAGLLAELLATHEVMALLAAASLLITVALTPALRRGAARQDVGSIAQSGAAANTP
jgi:MFS family permease